MPQSLKNPSTPKSCHSDPKKTCHSERSEESPYFAFALAVAFVLNDNRLFTHLRRIARNPHQRRPQKLLPYAIPAPNLFHNLVVGKLRRFDASQSLVDSRVELQIGRASCRER